MEITCSYNIVFNEFTRAGLKYVGIVSMLTFGHSSSVITQIAWMEVGTV